LNLSALLLVGFLLATQSMLVWHQHDDNALTDGDCQLCMHAHHHSPAPVSQIKPVLPEFMHTFIYVSAYTARVRLYDYLFSPSRAPPATLS
jgi:hypothetical protein